MPRIVHLGLGAFARSHLCSYTASPWSITGVGLLPGDAVVRDAHPERGYDLVLAHPDGQRSRSRIEVVDEYVFGPEGVVERLAAEDTRIVSLTITEGGWTVDSPAIALVVAGLAQRRRDGLPPFTVLSCDNIVGNGSVARRTVAACAGGELGDWVLANVSFPSSMVDRITPAPVDPGVVVAEPWRQWVLQDDFPLGRPSWDATFVEDVRPYELMKLRLLNAGHQAIAFLGTLRGHVFVHEAMRDPVVVDLLLRYWAEAVPTLEIVSDGYLDALVERFGNSYVADTLERLRAFTTDRIPVFLLPVLHERLARGLPVDACAEVLATWAAYVEKMPSLVVDNRPVRGGELLLNDLGLESVREPFLRALASLR